MTMSCRRVTFAAEVEDCDEDPQTAGRRALLEAPDAHRKSRSADLEGGPLLRSHDVPFWDRFPLNSPVCKTALVVVVFCTATVVWLYGGGGDEDVQPEAAELAPQRGALSVSQDLVSTTNGVGGVFVPPSTSSASTLSENCDGPLCIFHQAASRLDRDDPGRLPLQQRLEQSRQQALASIAGDTTTTTMIRRTSTKSTTYATVTRSTTSTSSTRTTSTSSASTTPSTSGCMVAKLGGACYGDVIKAMYDVREPIGKRQRGAGRGAICKPRAVSADDDLRLPSTPRVYGPGAANQAPTPEAPEPTPAPPPPSPTMALLTAKTKPKSIEDLVPNPRPVVDLVPRIAPVSDLGAKPKANVDVTGASSAGHEVTFAVGDQVEGNFKGWDWYGATVQAINPDGTYTVRWNDGDDEDTIKTPQELRQAKARRLHEFPCSDEELDEYGNLTRWSSFEEFQDFLYLNDPDSRCSYSCTCSTAKQGSKCYNSVLYSSTVGISEHPEWYSELTQDSPFEHFQDHLWQWFNDSKCERPCQASFLGTPSMFCWSLARGTGYEAQVMTRQLELGAGIFGCDGYAVVSETRWNVGRGPGKRIGQVDSLVFQGAEVGISKDGTAANTEQFILGWKAVIEHTTILNHDWAIKADPDAVIVVDRLRVHLKGSTGQSVFVRNCNSEPQNPDYPMMYGAMEAISKDALKVLRDGVDSCMIALDWHTWGEDYFLSKCFVHLQVEPLDDLAITSDGVCLGVDCNDPRAAAFHPFKGADEWTECWNSVTANMGGPPPPLP